MVSGANSERTHRQLRIATWVTETFGAPLMAKEERVARFLEEALELAQACGFSDLQAFRLLQHVYRRPPGDPRQEAGGVGVGLLALAEAFRFSADLEEERELRRIEAVPRDHFRARHAAKAAAGIAMPPIVELGADPIAEGSP